MTTAAITKAMSADGLSPHRHLPFQIRQMHNPTSTNASGTHKPKLRSQTRQNAATTPFHVSAIRIQNQSSYATHALIANYVSDKFNFGWPFKKQSDTQHDAQRDESM